MLSDSEAGGVFGNENNPGVDIDTPTSTIWYRTHKEESKN